MDVVTQIFFTTRHPLMTQSNLDSDAPYEPGHLLVELEQRQDEVLAQLDELDAKIKSVLLGLGATLNSEDGAIGESELPQAA